MKHFYKMPPCVNSFCAGHYIFPSKSHYIFPINRISEIVGSSGQEKVPTRGKPGATRKTTRREDGRITRQALVERVTVGSTIRLDVGVAIVPQTISRHLAEANLKSKRPFRALPLTPEHRQLRLQWCQARSIWNGTDWQKVVFRDESRFVLGTDDNRVRVWRRPGQRYVDDILRPHVGPFLNGLPGAVFQLVRIQQELLKTSYVTFRLFHGLSTPPICPL
ncbi:transposable element Tc1 transposase [Trichonephila clavipes]|uniref:Transposable element Tc1 transposase n=1 Tax=Trichonephila clavipes TaxID=2585209 RepID=A0A8X6V6H9_TRICX|nr:transposable element Tc1 transposase [Trichonephila clavipes]